MVYWQTGDTGLHILERKLIPLCTFFLSLTHKTNTLLHIRTCMSVTDRKIDRQTDRQTHRLTLTHTHTHTYTHTHSHAPSHTHTHTHTRTHARTHARTIIHSRARRHRRTHKHRHRDRQTDRQTDTHTHTHTHTHTPIVSLNWTAISLFFFSFRQRGRHPVPPRPTRNPKPEASRSQRRAAG